MAVANPHPLNDPAPDSAAAREDWLGRVARLLADLEAWGRADGWATRAVEARLRDAELGEYAAPGLVLERGPARLLVEPIARSAPGADGVVDLYALPAYDDVATLYHINGGWHVHLSTGGGVARPLTRDVFREVIEEMARHAA